MALRRHVVYRRLSAIGDKDERSTLQHPTACECQRL
jgi:hypothetical protein